MEHRRGRGSSGRLGLLLAALGLVAPASAAGQILMGTVFDAERDRRLPDAAVRVADADGETRGTAVTGRDGEFYLELPGLDPTWHLEAEALGYGPLRVLLGDLPVYSASGLGLRIDLQPDPLAVEGMTATVSGEPLDPVLASVGFYQRQHTDFGHFEVLGELDRTQARVLSDLMRGIPGVRLDILDGLTGGGGKEPHLRGATGHRAFENEKCYPSVFLNGSLLRRGGSLRDIRRSFDGLVHPNSVKAMEVYTSPSKLPAQYGGNQGGCGVILFWSR